jgi:hypothetical protein
LAIQNKKKTKENRIVEIQERNGRKERFWQKQKKKLKLKERKIKIIK